jgi:hypothetical protein
MDCIETYIEKYAVRNAGSLVRETTCESIAKANCNFDYTHKCAYRLHCQFRFLCLVVKRH